jgi:MoxR-like ATPase
MNRKLYYKIVETDGVDIFTLFHGMGGTRKLTPGKWLKAEIKENIRDGRGKRYTSGIHIVDGLEEARNYMRKFRRKDRAIVACYAKGLKPKSHSKHDVYLANEIKIIDKTFL